MAYLNPLVLDSGLATIVGSSRRLDICSAEPDTYAEATSTMTVGNKTGLTIGAAADGSPSGRKVTIPQVTSGAAGSVTGTATATHWALSDPGNSRLLAAGALSASQAVTSGNTFTTTAAIDIRLAGV